MKNTSFKSFFLVIMVSILMTSCASIISKTSYPISINSDPQRVEFIVKNKKGEEVMRNITPCTIKLDASSKYMSGEKYEITFKHPDYKEQKIYIHSRIEGWYWGNIFLGGLIGMLIVDPLTGAMYKLDTTPINIKLAAATAKSDIDAQLNIVDINTIPEEMKRDLVKIN